MSSQNENVFVWNIGSKFEFLLSLHETAHSQEWHKWQPSLKAFPDSDKLFLTSWMWDKQLMVSTRQNGNDNVKTYVWWHCWKKLS